MTNGDYIRQKMSDEYIAQEFCGIVAPFDGDCDDCPLCDNPKCALYEERIKWLKAEYVGEEETEVETKHPDFSYLLYAISDALRIIKCYEDCDYDKYCTSEGDGNIRDCIEGLQYVENELNKRKGEENEDL